MFSNIASFIFGGEEQPPTSATPPNATQDLIISSTGVATPSSAVATPPAPPSRKKSLEISEEDWVIVGEAGTPTLGSLADQSRTPLGSAGSSAAPSVSSDEEEMEAEPANPHARAVHTRSARRLTVPFSEAVASVPQMKSVMAAQKSKQKRNTKNLNSKSLERKNKAVKTNCRKQAMNHLPIKSAGFNKQLKQC